MDELFYSSSRASQLSLSKHQAALDKYNAKLSFNSSKPSLDFKGKPISNHIRANPGRLSIHSKAPSSVEVDSKLFNTLHLTASLHPNDHAHTDHYNSVLEAYKLLDTVGSDLEIIHPPKSSSLQKTASREGTPSIRNQTAPSPLIRFNSATEIDVKKKKDRLTMASEILTHKIKIENLILNGETNQRNFPLDPLALRKQIEIEAKKMKERQDSADADPETYDEVVDKVNILADVFTFDTPIEFKPPEGLWISQSPTPNYVSAPSLPRPLNPPWVPTSFRNPYPSAFSPTRGQSPFMNLNSDLVENADEIRRNIRSAPSFFRRLNPKYQKVVQSRYGAYPLSTRDRMEEVDKEQADRAWKLHEQYGDKWPWDDEFAAGLPMGKSRVRKLWRKAFIYAKAIVALKTKPPKQQTRQDLDKLLKFAIMSTRKKIYYKWEIVQGSFMVDAEREKNRQKRMNTRRKSLPPLPPQEGTDMKTSDLLTLLKESDINCTRVECLKLFGFQVGPELDEPMFEDGFEICLKWLDNTAEDKKTLKTHQDPMINFKLFTESVYPSSEEKVIWDEELAEKYRKQHDEETKDERARLAFETKLEVARIKAMAEVNEAWKSCYHEIYMNLIPDIVAARWTDVVYAKSRYKVGWGVPVSDRHKRSLFYIFSAGLEPVDVPTSQCKNKTKEKIVANNNITPHVSMKPVRRYMANCIQFSRGLDGLRAKEACELIIQYVTVRTQAAFRGRRKRRVYQKAIRMWRVKDRAFRTLYFLSWSKWAHGLVATRRYCTRPLREWNKVVKKIRKLQFIYKTAFWPFYVWRRWGSGNVMARKKAKLLKRVYDCYFIKSHFGAWARFALKEHKNERKSRSMKMRVSHDLLILILRKWKRYAFRRHVIRLRWDKRGHRMLQRKHTDLLNRSLFVWRYYAYCVKAVKRRNRRHFRNLILDDQDRRNHLTAEVRSSPDRSKKAVLSRSESVSVFLANSVDDPFHGTRYFIDGEWGYIPRTPLLPTVDETRWGLAALKGLGASRDNYVEICQPTHERFSLKEELAMKASHCIYMRSGVPAMQKLYNHVIAKKKLRYAAWNYTSNLKRSCFQVFKKRLKSSHLLPGDGASDEGEDELATVAKPGSQKVMSNRERLAAAATENQGVAANELEYDRRVRNDQTEKANEQSLSLQSYVELKSRQTARWNEEQKLKETLYARRKVELGKFMASISEGTLKADGNARDYMKDFQIHAARKLLDVTTKIRAEFDLFNSHNMKGRYLRRMRLIVMFRKVGSLYARQKLRNWLRLCARWRYVHRGMKVYRKLKDMWVVFNTWLKFIDRIYTFRSKDLSEKVAKRRSKLCLYDKLLVENKLIPVAMAYQVLNPIASTSVRMLMVRWIYYTNMIVGLRVVEEKAVRRFSLRLQRRVFEFWKTGVVISATYEKRRTVVPFLEAQCNVDIDYLKTNFIVHYRGKLSVLIYHANLKLQRKVATEAKEGPSFKKFILSLRVTVVARMSLEQKMLVEAFKNRGRLEFKDIKSTEIAGKGKPQKVEGDVIKNGRLAPGVKRFRDDALPPGFGMSEVTVVLKQGQGIVGIMSKAKVEEKERDLGMYGCISEGYRVTFALKAEEQLVAVEVCSGTVIERIKFHSSSGRKSDWIGSKISATPHWKKLAASGADIDGCLYPEGKYIVGLHGFENTSRIIGLGIITRVVTKQFVFSYNWIDDGAEDDPEPAVPLRTRLDKRRRRSGSGEIVNNSSSSSSQVNQRPQTVASPPKQETKKHRGGTPGQEFAHVLRMRRSDIEDALTRSEVLARMLWTSTKIFYSRTLSPLSKFRIVCNLTKWFFEACAFRLVALPLSDGMAERLIIEGIEMKRRGARVIEKAYLLRNRIDVDAMKDRPWRTTGMIGPVDRKKESDYKVKLSEGWLKADAFEAEGGALIEAGEAKVGEGKTMMPTIANSPGVMKYYSSLLNVARRQIQLENDFGADYFKSIIQGSGSGTTGSGAGSGAVEKCFPLDDGSLKAIVGTVKAAQVKHGEGLERDRLETLYSNQPSSMMMSQSLNTPDNKFQTFNGRNYIYDFSAEGDINGGANSGGRGRALLPLPQPSIVEAAEKIAADSFAKQNTLDKSKQLGKLGNNNSSLKFPSIGTIMPREGELVRMQKRQRPSTVSVSELRKKGDFRMSRSRSVSGLSKVKIRVSPAKSVDDYTHMRPSTSPAVDQGKVEQGKSYYERQIGRARDNANWLGLTSASEGRREELNFRIFRKIGRMDEGEDGGFLSDPIV